MKLKDLAVGRRDILMIPPHLIIRRKGWNDRDPDETDPQTIAHVRTLADDIKINGVIVPLEVELIDEKPHVVDGFSRHRATELAISEGAEIHAIPCISKARGMGEIDTHFQKWSANIQEGLSPLAQGRFFARMLAFGLTIADLHRRTGKSRTHIDNCLELLEAPQAILDAVRGGDISASAAMEAIKREGATAATQSISKAVSDAKASGKKRVGGKAIRAASEAPVQRTTARELKEILAECLSYLDSIDLSEEPGARRLVRKIKAVV